MTALALLLWLGKVLPWLTSVLLPWLGKAITILSTIVQTLKVTKLLIAILIGFFRGF